MKTLIDRHDDVRTTTLYGRCYDVKTLKRRLYSAGKIYKKAIIIDNK